jgi:hypothetical protein
MKEEIDLSFSGLSDTINGDKQVGKELLIKIACDYFKYTSRLNELEKELTQIKNQLGYTRGGINNAMQHLKLSKPLAIVTDNGLIVISEIDVTLEKNVL